MNPLTEIPSYTRFVEELNRIKPLCAWSSGAWNFGTDIDGQPIVRKWNELQNLSKDISLVTDYLVTSYIKAANQYIKRGICPYFYTTTVETC